MDESTTSRVASRSVAYHIPRNEGLMKINPNSAGASAIWSHFVTPWVAWNHVRTLTSIGGTASLIVALRAS